MNTFNIAVGIIALLCGSILGYVINKVKIQIKNTQIDRLESTIFDNGTTILGLQKKVHQLEEQLSALKSESKNNEQPHYKKREEVA